MVAGTYEIPPRESHGAVAKTLLACGLFRRFPGPREQAAHRIVAKGFGSAEVEMLFREAQLLQATDPCAVVAKWLKDEDDSLEERILELREEVRASKAHMDPTRQEKGESAGDFARRQQDHQRREALAWVDQLMSDDAIPLCDAVEHANKDFERVLWEPLTIEEVERAAS